MSERWQNADEDIVTHVLENEMLDARISDIVATSSEDKLEEARLKNALLFCLERARHFLSAMVCEPAADAAWEAILEHYKNRNGSNALLRIYFPDAPSEGLMFIWEMPEIFQRLERYGDEGVDLDGTISDLAENIPGGLMTTAAFLKALPEGWFDATADRPFFLKLWLTFAKARARLKLDLGRPLMLADAALLSGMALKSVSNATQKSRGEKRLIVRNGHIAAIDALAWLEQRRGFTPSPESDSSAKTPMPAASKFDDFLFVPVDDEGNQFLPGVGCDPSCGEVSYPSVVLDGKEVGIYEREGYFETLEKMVLAEKVAWLADGRFVECKGWAKVPRMKLRLLEIEIQEAAQKDWKSAIADRDQQDLE